MTNLNVATADEWRQQLDSLGPIADLHEYHALLQTTPSDLPAEEREYLAGFIVGRTHRAPTGVECAYVALRPLLDQLDDESAWTRHKVRELRRALKAFATIAPSSVGDQAIRRQIAEELGHVGGFTDLVSLLLC